MKIVLDANILFRDWYLDGPDFRVIEKHMALCGSELIVPEIIVLETVNNHRKQVSKHCGAVRKLRGLVRGTGDSLISPDPNAASEAYQEALSARLTALGATRPTHADVPHDAVVERALKTRKPFGQSDRGYRDCLLWEVILTKVASGDDQTFLVSDNTRDFADKNPDDGLHSDFREDLSRAGLPEDCVILYTSLRNLVEHQIATGLRTAVDGVSEAICKGTYAGFNLVGWLRDSDLDLVEKCNADIEEIIGIPELESPEVTHVEPPEPTGVSVDKAYRTDDEHVVIYATVEADVTVDGYIFKAEYYGLDDSCPLEIMDDDWNKHYMWAQLNVTLPLHIALVLDVIANEVVDWRVDSIAEAFGWCRQCGSLIFSDSAESCASCGKRLM